MYLYFVRHGQSEGNVRFVPGAIRPKTDPLTKLGREQAAKAADYLKHQEPKPTLIISSPYTRTIDTAKIIEKDLKIPLAEDERLGEYISGDWEGLPEDEFRQRFYQINPDERYLFHPPGGGESWLEAAQRINAVIEEAESQGHTCVVLVSHLDPIRAIINLLTKKSFGEWDLTTQHEPGSVTPFHKTIED